MESSSVNRQIRLRRRPQGRVCDADFELVSEPIPRLRPGQALIRNLVLSVEAASRIWVGHSRCGIEEVFTSQLRLKPGSYHVPPPTACSRATEPQHVRLPSAPPTNEPVWFVHSDRSLGFVSAARPDRHVTRRRFANAPT